MEFLATIPGRSRPSGQTWLIERVFAYLDGFNIYNGMMAKGWGHLRWLDYPTLLRRYMRDQQVLVGIKYFTAPMTHQPDKYARQQQYIQALEVRGGIEIVPGKWSTKPIRCRKCGRSFKVPQEKRSDVNLATHLVADAFDDRFDTFVVCSADSDLIPAVAYVQDRFLKRFILIDPPRRHSDELAEVAGQHLHSRGTYYRQSQLPDPVGYITRRGKTKRIHRPLAWSDKRPTTSRSEPDDDGRVHCMSCDQPLPADHAAVLV